MLRALVGEDCCVLPEGSWAWLDLLFDRPARPSIVKAALGDMGFEAKFGWVPVNRYKPDEPSREFRTVAKTRCDVTLKSRPGLLWRGVAHFPINPEEALSFKTKPFKLEQGKVYSFRFLSRDRTAARPDDVAVLLEAIGWEYPEVCVARRDMRVPSHPGTDVSEWLGFATWVRPNSLVTGDEPFFFEEVVAA